MIAAPLDPEYDEERGRYIDSETPDRGIDLLRWFPNRGSVLVDESHNFRNINQRSRGLRNYLEAGDHKGSAAPHRKTRGRWTFTGS